MECCESLLCNVGEQRIKQITWSCPRCTALSCPELSQRELSGPRCVLRPGRKGAEGGSWWWRSPVSSEVHGPCSGFSCRAQSTILLTNTITEIGRIQPKLHLRFLYSTCMFFRLEETKLRIRCPFSERTSVSFLFHRMNAFLYIFLLFTSVFINI